MLSSSFKSDFLEDSVIFIQLHTGPSISILPFRPWHGDLADKDSVNFKIIWTCRAINSLKNNSLIFNYFMDFVVVKMTVSIFGILWCIDVRLCWCFEFGDLLSVGKFLYNAEFFLLMVQIQGGGPSYLMVVDWRPLWRKLKLHSGLPFKFKTGCGGVVRTRFYRVFSRTSRWVQDKRSKR